MSEVLEMALEKKFRLTRSIIIKLPVITILRLLKNTTFSTAIHCLPDIIRNVRIIVETSDTRLLDALCDVNTEGKMM